MDLDKVYGNLNLYALEDEELYELGINCVKVITLGVHLIEYSGDVERGGIVRDFDLDKYELSDLMLRSNKLITKFKESERRKYIGLLDDTLFIFVVYDAPNDSVKGYIKQNIFKELKGWVRTALRRETTGA